MSEWGIPEVSEVDPKQREAAKEFASRYFRLFNTQDGKVVLEHWVRSTLLAPAVIEGQDPKADGIREGQARLVRGILAQVAYAADEGAPIPLDALYGAAKTPRVGYRYALALAVVAFVVGVVVGLMARGG